MLNRKFLKNCETRQPPFTFALALPFAAGGCSNRWDGPFSISAMASGSGTSFLHPADSDSKMRLLPVGRLRRAVLLCACLVTLAGLYTAGRTAWFTVRLELARRALQARDARRALEHLQAVEPAAPDHAELNFLLARTYRRLGRLDLVRTRIERAWKSGYSIDRLKREQWLALAQAGQLREAEPHLPRLLAEPGEDGPEICEAFINGYLQTYRFQEAAGLLDAWQADYPNDPQPEYIRGLYAEHNGRDSEAAEAYRRALRLAPDRRDVRMALAQVLVDLRRHDEAAEQIGRLLKEDPENPDLRAGWGQCLMEQGRLSQAREIFVGLLKAHPDHFGSRLALGQLEFKAGRPQDALKWLEPVVEEQPLHYSARFALASALQAAGRREEAARHFEYVAAAQRGLSRARELMDRVKADPKDTELRYQIGTILLQYDSPAEGAGWLRSVLELQPDHRPTHLALADYYEGRANRSLAERHRELANAPEGSAWKDAGTR